VDWRVSQACLGLKAGGNLQNTGTEQALKLLQQRRSDLTKMPPVWMRYLFPERPVTNLKIKVR
jgi:hypothetical protein